MILPVFLTESVAKYATEWTLNATIHNPGMQHLFSRKMCHIVVLVPSMDGSGIKPHVLYERSVGDRDEWPHDFAGIARSKADQLWRGQNDDRTDLVPHLLFPGDTPYWGGVKRRNIVTACSGVQPHFDKMISGMISDMVVALAYDAWVQSDCRKHGTSFLV